MSSIPPPARRTLRPGRLIALVVGSAVAAGGLLAAHRYQLEKQVGTWKERAETAAADGHWDAAAECYRTYLNFRRDDADAVAKYADAVEKSSADRPGGTERLVPIFEQLLRLDPARPDPRRKLARWYLDQRHLTSARDHIAYLLDHGGADDPDLLEMLAVCDAGERKFDAARASLEKAVATGKAGPTAVLALAELLRTEFKSADALAQADRVMADLVAARPADLAARLSRARYRMAAGDTAGAAADVDIAVTLPGGATDPQALLARADVAVRRDDLPAAREALEKAVAAAPDNLTARLALADTQARSNDPAAAAVTLRGVADRPGKPTFTLLEAADRLIDLGDTAAAEKSAARFAAEPGLQPFADYLNGRAKLAAGDWPAALGLLTKAVASADVQRVPGVFLKAQLGLAEC
ncbi:MAG: tetratricopeptide repeat protein, partial [Fimbriiglobus sp.]